ncbi:hypothetical protein Golob_024103 [Gossypium lobatum]|uniref:Endonuclease/exonuclease/phosphatase domain-containing protein n=1 Tax=Gossypium lobatum TaxID=34289 RepID=A0A7J8NFK9_9ROSI|nr:hypothetical protein [Gossypium lobatum]
MEKRPTKLSREGCRKMRDKRKRARGSCGELTEESPSRTVRRKLLDGLSPLKAGAGLTNEVPMLELSWDGEPATVRELKQLLVANNPDIIFHSETKMNANYFHRIQNKCRMQNGLAVSSKGRSGGLAWIFTGFYGNANPNLRSTSWDILRRVGGVVREDWVVGGDFNAILNDAEKDGGRRCEILSKSTISSGLVKIFATWS